VQWCTKIKGFRNDLVLDSGGYSWYRIFSGMVESMESLDLSGLVLGFRIGESVMVDGCKITLDSVKGDRIRLRFNAPLSVKITRTNAKKKEPRKHEGCD